MAHVTACYALLSTWFANKQFAIMHVITSLRSSAINSEQILKCRRESSVWRKIYVNCGYKMVKYRSRLIHYHSEVKCMIFLVRYQEIMISDERMGRWNRSLLSELQLESTTSWHVSNLVLKLSYRTCHQAVSGLNLDIHIRPYIN